MRHLKRYLCLMLCIGCLCFLQFHTNRGEFDSVDSFRGAELDSMDWNPLIAASVNERPIYLTIDNKEYSSQDTDIYMDDQLNLMVPVSIVKDAMNCSTHLYNDVNLLVEKHNNEAMFSLNNPNVLWNQKTMKVTSPLTGKKGNYYISVRDVSETMGYQFQWDMNENRAVTLDSSDSASIYPVKYNLRTKDRIGVIKDQGDTGTCWAFAALSALESSLLPEEKVVFSPEHMSKNNSFSMDSVWGGEYRMGLAYLLAWQGPVYESEDPFGDGVTDHTLRPVKHVQEVQIFEGKDYEKIKEAVFKYGGVQTSLYSTMNTSGENDEFFNQEENAYCYIGTEKPNHEVVIVGWDDTFPKENFPVNIEGDGAFLCQNSWGKGFGDDGLFYVSYYDTNIGSHNVVYTKVEETDNYKEIYQSDLCGWVGQIGYEKEELYGANVFTARDDEILSAVGFYATGKDTEYKIYVVEDFYEQKDFRKKHLVAEGKVNHAGYYTIPIEEVSLSKDKNFAVILDIKTPGSIHPMAIEYAADETTQNVDLEDGQGYISLDGETFIRTEDVYSCNVCIKAYTKEK